MKLASKGPVARAARRLKVSMAEVSRLIGVNTATLRTWDARRSVPPEVTRRIKLLLADKGGAR